MSTTTTTGTLAAGESKTFTLAPGAAVSLTLSPNPRVTITETPESVSGSGVGGNTSRVHEPQLPGTFAYGPYAMGGVVVVAVASNSGSSVAWTRKDTVVTTSSDGTSLVSGDGTELLPIGAGLVDTTVTATGTLPITALGRITPVNATGSTTQTLPSAATAWALKPYGVVVLVQRGAGVPSFAAGGGDTLRATSGIGACVQYGMIAAQVQSATEWALA
jgi:hypothetical protein